MNLLILVCGATIGNKIPPRSRFVVEYSWLWQQGEKRAGGAQGRAWELGEK